jgi:hypothetical protein
MASPFRPNHALLEAVDLPTDAWCLPPISSGDLTSPCCDSPLGPMVTLSGDLGTAAECRGLSSQPESAHRPPPRGVQAAYLAVPDPCLRKGKTRLTAGTVRGVRIGVRSL